MGSRHVYKARTVINSKFSNKDLLSFSGWSQSKIKQRFESSIACMSHRHHRTYDEVLSNKGDMGYTGAEHINTPVTDFTAPKQVVNTNSIDGKHRYFHAKGRHINRQDTGILHAKMLLSDLIDSGSRG